jgi:hypothetical protein
MSIILDALRTPLLTKQKEGDNLQDYTKRFRAARNVLDSHLGGPLILTKIIKMINEYHAKDQVKKEKYARIAFEQLLGYLYLENTDQTKYGSILAELNTQHYWETINTQRPSLSQIMYSAIISLMQSK